MSKKKPTLKEVKNEQADATEFQGKLAAAHLHARGVAKEVFRIVNPSRQIINDVYDRVIYLDDQGDVSPDTEKGICDLVAACAWAKEVYDDSSPEAVFDAFDRAFDLDEADDDGDSEEVDSDD